MAYIYSILNIKNNKAYIGQTIKDNLWDRIRKHFEKLRTNTHPNKKLQNAYNKYGEENFIYFPLCTCEKHELNKLEIQYIKLFDTFKSGYNMTEGGQGIISQDAQLKNKISNQMKWDNILKINPNSLKIEKIYPSQNEAARAEGIPLSNIAKSCKDKGRIIKNYIYIKESDYTSTWKPHIRTNAAPLCLINKNNNIICFFESKKDAMRYFGFNNTYSIDKKIKNNVFLNFEGEEGRLIQITQEEYYKYDTGTCIDYPR